MGTENPGRPTFPSRPSPPPFPAAQAVTPFSSTGSVVGSEPPSFRSAPPAPPPQAATPFSSAGPAAVRPGAPSFRPAPPGRFNDPSVPPPPPQSSNAPPAAGPFQQFPAAPFAPTTQPRAPPLSIGQPSFQSPHSLAPPFPTSLPAQPQMPFVPMGSPSPQSAAPAHMGSNVPPPTFQPSFPGYPSKQTGPEMQGPPLHSSFPANQGNFGPVPPAGASPFLSHQGGYVSSPPVAPPLGIQPMQQQPGSLPPMSNVHGLAEDFNALTMQTRPGTMDPLFDPKELPRPLEGDVEPKNLLDMYPMNCNPRFLRLTTSAVPSSQSLASRWHLPLGAVVSPLAEPPDGEEVPIVNFAPASVVRCRRCRTYVNPYMTFTEAGRKFRCNVCTLLNDVPSEYYSQLDATGKRADINQRPELTKGTVEFVAPAEYMVRPPMPPVYFFLIDVSISAVRSGMIEVVANTIKSCLDELPGFPRTQIGFATFDSTIHFYNMKSSLTQPQMLVVSDLDDIFIPLPDDLLVNLSESRSVVDTFLDSLPTMFQDNVNLESAFGPALKAAFMVMSQLGGKLLIFQNSLPSLGVGRLKLRGDDSRVYGTDKEHGLRLPEDPFYKQMAAEFSKYQISANVYAFSDKYTDVRVGHCAVIDLSNNTLSGNFSRIGYWGNYVEVVQLSTNTLIGMLPNETSQFLRLTELKASNNLLEGFLPPILGTYPELKEIDLSLNQLSGVLLPSFFYSTKLINLNLSNNKFSGLIPIQVQPPNIPLVSTENISLVFLDLSHNNLSGTLPSNMSSLHNLSYLNLCNNKLEGTIPDDLPDELRVLNVSFNNFSGVVPENIKHFPESAFHPGNPMLVFPLLQSSPKDTSNLGLREHRLHKRSATRIALIASLVAGAFVMAFVGIIIYYKVHHEKEMTSKQNEARGITQESTFTSNIEAAYRNLEALPPSQRGSSDAASNIHPVGEKPMNLGRSELGKKAEGMYSPMSILSPSNPSSSKSHQFENPGSLQVSSPDKLVGDLHIFDGSLVLTAEELSCAPAEVIGRSCHGTLYKATLDSGHHALAIKWLREGITKGKKELAREIKKLGTIKHPNLVSIQGYYLGPKEHEKLIISNYMNAQSLDIYLHEVDKTNLHPLTLDERLRVATEVALCLHFLHDEKAIPHGNLKSTNILLETPNRNVLLTDYSLHRILTAAGTTEQVLNAGALGYRPPEFARSSKPCPSLTSDVYAFGVVLLELLTGRNSGEIVSGIPGVVDLTDWVRFLAEQDRSSQCFDRSLVDKHNGEKSSKVLDDMLKVALRCILPASDRPDMKTVFDDLSTISTQQAL